MQLMISVVSAAEAGEAVLGGAEILDVKNPAEGSLGAQSPRVIRQIKNLAPETVKVSAAIGDMPHLPGTAALAALGGAVCGADYIKVGLYGPRSAADAVRLLKEVCQAVSEHPSAVIAGAYADFQRAGTLDPRLLPRLAAEAGVHGCLLDTAIKDGRSLFDFLSPESVQAMAEEAHAAGLLFGLAGALHAEHLPLARQLGADVVGIRSAACRDQQRSAPLEAARVRRLVQALRLPVEARRP